MRKLWLTATVILTILFVLSACVSTYKKSEIQETTNNNNNFKNITDNISKEPEFNIDDGFQKGMYKISGYVNSGEKGYIYLKVFDNKSGKSVLDYYNLKQSIEYTGWSNKSYENYYFNMNEITIKVGYWDHQYDARFEIWFNPDKGSKDRLIMKKVRKIYGWER